MAKRSVALVCLSSDAEVQGLMVAIIAVAELPGTKGRWVLHVPSGIA